MSLLWNNKDFSVGESALISFSFSDMSFRFFRMACSKASVSVFEIKFILQVYGRQIKVFLGALRSLEGLFKFLHLIKKSNVCLCLLSSLKRDLLKVLVLIGLIRDVSDVISE